MQVKSQIMDREKMKRVIIRISHEIIEKNDVNNLVILGIKKNGVPLAKFICDNISSFEKVDIPFGTLDITNERDDYTVEEKKAMATQSIIPCDIANKTVVIVDDVLYTGRTIKAAIGTIFKYGRPKYIQVAVLVDRGHRELPIKPDFIGKNVPTSRAETILVKYCDEDEAGVYIAE